MNKMKGKPFLAMGAVVLLTSLSGCVYGPGPFEGASAGALIGYGITGKPQGAALGAGAGGLAGFLYQVLAPPPPNGRYIHYPRYHSYGRGYHDPCLERYSSPKLIAECRRGRLRALREANQAKEREAREYGYSYPSDAWQDRPSRR